MTRKGALTCFEFPFNLVDKSCPLHPAEREVLRKVSPKLDLKILLDTKKGHGGQVLRLITATTLLMARLTKQLVKILLSVNL